MSQHMPQGLGQTPSQTVGPFFAYGLVPSQYGYAMRSLWGPVLAEPRTPGQPIRLIGQVFDGRGDTVMDALIEIKQADAGGRYPDSPESVAASGFTGFGRMGTGSRPDHAFEFQTIKPGPTPDGQAPHIDVIVSMRGLLNHLFTRVYFDDETAANAADAVLGAVPAARRATLVARGQDLPGGRVYRFDIHLQGPQETVFFDV